MTKKVFITDLVTYINDNLLQNTNGKINKDTLLFEERIINSLKIIELIAFVEVTLKINVGDEMISMENFRSVKTIAESFYDYAKKSK